MKNKIEQKNNSKNQNFTKHSLAVMFGNQTGASNFHNTNNVLKKNTKIDKIDISFLSK